MKMTVQPAQHQGRKRTVGTLCLFGLLAVIASAPYKASGQATPTADRAIFPNFSLPHADGTLNFAISAAESVTEGYYSNSGQYASTSLSGDVAYLSKSAHPFSMVFSGGKSWSESGVSSPIFLSLSLSQVFTTGRWNFVLSDAVSYLPQTASVGLSGIPGNGDLGVSSPLTGTGAEVPQGVLTETSARVSNSATAGASRSLTGKTSLQLSGSYSMLRYVGDGSGGFNGDSVSGNLGLSHTLDARNNIGGNLSYSQSLYGSGEPGYASETASLSYGHQITRLLSMNIAAGPQRTSALNSPVPYSTYNLFVSASLAYTGEFTNYSLGYTRGTNSGFGVTLGSRSDSVHFSAQRTFARVWNGVFTSTYARTTGLGQPGTTNFSAETLVDAVQVSRALGRSFSMFAGYTLENQSTTGSTGAFNVFSGLLQVASFGITYSPASLHLGSQ